MLPSVLAKSMTVRMELTRYGVDCSVPVYKDDAEPQLTLRAVGAGLLVGSLLCCSNTYFGLQTGWVTMGSLQVCMHACLHSYNPYCAADTHFECSAGSEKSLLRMHDVSSLAGSADKTCS